MLYSKSTGGFYTPELHGADIPADAVEITAEQHAALFVAQGAGLVIQADANGFPVAVDPPGPTQAQRQAAFTAQIQGVLDAKAQEYGYDSIANAVTYAGETAVPKFNNEGKALRAWRSKVWAAAYDLLARVEAGTAPEPTAETLPGLLPTYEAPA